MKKPLGYAVHAPEVFLIPVHDKEIKSLSGGLLSRGIGHLFQNSSAGLYNCFMIHQVSPLRDPLIDLYGDENGRLASERIKRLTGRYPSPWGLAGGRNEREGSQRDSILITYADGIYTTGQPPLHTLREFCEAHLKGVMNGIHLLPFYPSSSDDGFSVMDYRQVDPALGTWADIGRFREHFRLMFDAVINHVSAQSRWFQGFLRGDPRDEDFFISVAGSPDLSQVVRPRALPLLTEFETVGGKKRVWTTFSADQIDLNYANPDVLLEVIDLLIFYASQGADFIRLDAIAYLWKEFGTSCIHLPQTHRVIQVFRAVLDRVAPHVSLITETNVPHAENIAYFGDGSNEAQLVYNFALPPLVLHTFYNENAAALTRWAASLSLPSRQVTFFNFLASHDGIGLNPARGILSETEIERLVEKTLAHGGLISYKHNADGTRSPYELNINYFDALSDPLAPEPLDLQIDRFIAAHAILLSLLGVPGIYYHSLLGSRGWPEGIAKTGQNRTINRQKLVRAELEEELNRPDSPRRQVFLRMKQLLSIRAQHPAFHPFGSQRVIEWNPAVLTLLRSSPNHAGDVVLCLQNVTGRTERVDLDLGEFSGLSRWPQDLITGRVFPDGKSQSVLLAPYQTVWLSGLVRRPRSSYG